MLRHGSALTSKASSNLLNDDVLVRVIVSSIRKNAHYIRKSLIFTDEESISGESSGRASL